MLCRMYSVNKLVNNQMMLEFLLLMIQFSLKEVKRSSKHWKKECDVLLGGAKPCQEV